MLTRSTSSLFKLAVESKKIFDYCSPALLSFLERGDFKLEQMDASLIERMRAKAFEKGKESFHLEPILPSSTFEQLAGYEAEGKSLIAQNKVGALVMAGGMGSRVRSTMPKGCIPVSAIKGKSLFELMAEKTLACGKQLGQELQLAIFTSSLNHAESVDFFKKNEFFGLKSSQVDFFSQPTWPLLDFEGRLFLEAPSQLAMGPGGNGGVLKLFRESPIWTKWKEIGIEMVNVLPIDNPLADPFDARMAAFHAKKGNDITLKAACRSDPEESVGVICKRGATVAVVEYCELEEEKKRAKNSSGELLFGLANLGLYLFSMDFIERVREISLPLHCVKKSTRMMCEKGSVEFPEVPNCYKFELFIFDLLRESKAVDVILYPREQTFAVLKNSKGIDSIQSVKEALMAKDRSVISELFGIVVPQEREIELAAHFHYPTASLIQKWAERTRDPSFFQSRYIT